MNSKFTLFFVALFAMPLSSHARVGGPFDGNDYSATLDNSGIYQTAFRFKNGSGFSQWGNNVDVSTASTTSSASTKGSYLNRSIIYCNGIVFFGMATGIVDHEAKLVMGYTNGTATETADNSTKQPVVTNTTGTPETPYQPATPTTTVTTPVGTTVTAGNPAVPGTSAQPGTANTEWSAKITQTSPELRYCGTGEITVLNPNATDVAATINTQLTAAIADIVAITDPNAGPAETAQQMIEFNQRLVSAQLQAVAALRSYSSRVSSADNGFTQKMTVFGARKFFFSRR